MVINRSSLKSPDRLFIFTLLHLKNSLFTVKSFTIKIVGLQVATYQETLIKKVRENNSPLVLIDGDNVAVGTGCSRTVG